MQDHHKHQGQALEEKGCCALGAPFHLATWQEQLPFSEGIEHGGVMAALKQEISLLWHQSSESKQDDQEEGQWAASDQCSQQSLAPGKSCTEAQHPLSNDGRIHIQWLFPWHLSSIQPVRG